MLLTIDIGNTNISFGVFTNTCHARPGCVIPAKAGIHNVYPDKEKLLRKFDIPTNAYCLKQLKKSLGGLKVQDAVICSVVPKTAKLLEKDLFYLLKHKSYVIGRDIIVPIRNLYRNPKQVGSDRLVNAYAGIVLYGSPLILIDFGTAITFDVVSKNKEYLGGLILPGLGISLDALNQRTALLPKIKLGKPKKLIAQDTKNSILSGIVYGFSSLADGLIEKLKNKIGKNAVVIGTGGNIDLIKRYSQKFDKIDKNLTLKGLSLIYKNFKKIQ